MDKEEDIFIFHRCDLDPEFALIWKDLQSNDNYLDLCDVRLECFDGYSCHAHQSLLRVISKRFRDAINHYYKIRGPNYQIPDGEEMVITLPLSVTSQEFESIINYIYTGIVYVPESRVNQFLRVSKIMKINGLKNVTLIYEEPKGETRVEEASQSTSQSFTRVKQKPKSANYLDKVKSHNICGFNSLKKSYNKHDWISRTANLVKKKYSSIATSNGNRKRLQGRRPQTGSPMITDEFKIGDRYRCKVCHKTYLWKKSLVRHYKDLHPKDIELVP